MGMCRVGPCYSVYHQTSCSCSLLTIQGSFTAEYYTLLSDIRHKDFCPPPCSALPSGSGDPRCILKLGGLRSSGWRLIFLNRKTIRRIDYCSIKKTDNCYIFFSLQIFGFLCTNEHQKYNKNCIKGVSAMIFLQIRVWPLLRFSY